MIQLNKQQVQPVEWVTVEEQLDYIRFFERKIMDYCQFFKFNETVQATALMFFKRFYIEFTIMDYEPKKILYFPLI